MLQSKSVTFYILNSLYHPTGRLRARSTRSRWSSPFPSLLPSGMPQCSADRDDSTVNISVLLAWVVPTVPATRLACSRVGSGQGHPMAPVQSLLCMTRPGVSYTAPIWLRQIVAARHQCLEGCFWNLIGHKWLQVTTWKTVTSNVTLLITSSKLWYLLHLITVRLLFQQMFQTRQ